MRTFLVGMCDIFLILYLTSITSVQSTGVLTVEDFFELKSQHEELQADKRKAEEDLKEKLRREQEEKARLLAEKQLQEEMSEARLKELAGEKEDLQAALTEEKGRLGEMEQVLASSDAERERINKELQEKQALLKARELMLEGLNREIAEQEEEWRKIKASYQEELATQKETIETNRMMAEQLQGEVLEARLQAEKIQERARAEKAEAERKASEALAARQQAEAEKQIALQVAEAEKANTKRAQRSVRILSAEVKEIKQDVDTAYENNIRALLQTLNVTYEREIAGGITRYERELRLLPVNIKGLVYVVFPSRQIGFSSRTDTPPDKLVIMYQDQKIPGGRMNKESDLIALPLPGYDTDIYAPYSAGTALEDLMPSLLALRNNGNVSLLDKVRGISDDYFVVNRDYLRADKGPGLKYAVSGLPGTGTRAERIIPGDQLVDLNGRMIGVANRANRIVPIDTVQAWDEIAF